MIYDCNIDLFLKMGLLYELENHKFVTIFHKKSCLYSGIY
nr:MAG TPA: hypothetical protein [Caudoviricetes sp.]